MQEGTERLLNYWIAKPLSWAIFGLWLALKFTVGIRVSEHEEIEGLDIGEHGNEAYHGFVMSGTDN